MTIDDLRKFADSAEGHIRQIALTKEAARAIVREHDREVNAASNDPELFAPRERADEGRYAARQYAGIAAVLADEARIAAEGGGMTTAAMRECL